MRFGGFSCSHGHFRCHRHVTGPSGLYRYGGPGIPPVRGWRMKPRHKKRMMLGFSAAGMLWLSIFLLASCNMEQDKPEVGVDRSASEARVDASKTNHVCGASLARRDFCPTDFVRLASSPASANEKQLWIIGYLAVDGGQVALFSSERAYMNMEYGRSIRVEGSRSDLSSLVSQFGYQMVRLAGEFHANSFEDPKNDRLGVLLPPVEARRAQTRMGPREGVDDIRVGSEYEQPEEASSGKSEKGPR